MLQMYKKTAEAYPSSEPRNLTTVDVYKWLEKEGHFIRPRKSPLNKQQSNTSRAAIGSAKGAVKQTCPYCGCDSILRKTNIVHQCKIPIGSKRPPAFDIHEIISESRARPNQHLSDRIELASGLFDYARMSIEPSLVISVNWRCDRQFGD